MKLKLSFAAMSVSVLLTACQHTQPSKPEAAAPAPMTAPVPVAPAAVAAPAAPAARVAASTPASDSASVDGGIIIDNSDSSFKSEGNWSSASGGNDFKDDTTYASPT